MKQIKWIFLLFAFAAVASIMLIGVAIAEKSVFGVTGALAAVIVIMGAGFTLKKKMREKGILE
ncbi:YlaF family protein [Bacillus sonorensis]|uniref:YlaF family protein n=1 Tax=Bacillus sonorensis TaxID=119858 RepID=UPI0004956BEB|nr:YlaF family protein [Bacillus sonorensis]MCY8406031.1 YlaF family protein [Bacillus sonorensis]MEC1441213.1 YlaF family protein [Bacillus sonorensis]MEC1590359.1 YlaF family protein [Bacillus sonorensis]